MNTRCLSAILAAVLLAAGLPSAADAAVGAFYDGTNTLISGQAPFFDSSSQLYGYVDYAVYSPGNFAGSASFPAGKYAYCYQIFDSSTSSDIGKFTVKLDAGVTAYSPGSFVFASGDIDSFTESFSAPTVTYQFNSRPPTLSANHYSYVLFFAADSGPVIDIDSGAIAGTKIGSTSVQIPTPTPEPASLLLLALASPVLLKTRRRKS